ncbi:MAG: PaaX family transcriptional regulator [Haloechinothrix sp.]
MDVSAPRTRRRSDGSPSARALLFTLLGEYVRYAGEERVWSSTIIEALAAFGIDESATRRTITRVAHDGWLTTESVGRYTQLVLTARMVGLLRSWTERLTRATTDTPWHGEWQFLLLRLANEHRPIRGVVEERLTFEGFGTLGRGVWIAADAGGKQAVRESLEDLGVADRATWMVTRVEWPEERTLIEQAWDLAAIRPLHEHFVSRFDKVEPASDEDAFVARTRMVHEWRLTFNADPRLPSCFLPPDWPGRRATELFIHNWLRWHEAAEAWWQKLAEPRAPKSR